MNSVARGASVSVVIPCFNGASTLSRQLEALLNQTYEDHFEIVVANNRSTDDTLRIVEKFAIKCPDRIRLLAVDACGRSGINHARNCGVRATSGEFVTLCDADDVVDRDWLRQLTSALAETDIVGSVLQSSQNLTSSGDLSPGVYGSFSYLRWVAGAGMAFRRTVFDDIGGFDEQYRGGGDETDFCWRAQRAGFQLSGCPKAIVCYSERSSAKAIWKQSASYGESHVLLYSKHSAFGMPRRWGFHSALRVGAVAVRVGARGMRCRSITAADWKTCGLLWGRLKGSLKYRTFYV